MKRLFSALALAGATATAALSTTPAAAQNWEPTKPIQIIIPYAPGGGPDTLLNILIPELTKRLGQSLIMIHRPGGTTVIGTQATIRAQADGHNIGLVTDQLVINQLLMQNLQYNSADLLPLTQLVEGYFVLAAGVGRPFTSLQQLLTQAKANPDKFTYATPGTGSPHHLMMESLSQAAGVRMRAVAYQGSAQMITDLIGGHVDMLLVGAVTAVDNIKAGKMVALGTMSPTRLPLAPEIPTIGEAGLPGFSSSFWYGLVVPKGTPAAASARLNREVVAVLNMPEVKEKIAKINFFPRPTTPDEFSAIIKRDLTKYEKVIAQAKIKLDQ